MNSEQGSYTSGDMPEAPTPLVSVIMAVHNGQDFLDDSVRSILDQTLRDIEFIVVDDGSTDTSLDILKAFAATDARLRIIENGTNHGLSRSLNRALMAARSKYVARHDADDIAMPDRLRLQAHFLDVTPDVFMVGGSVIIVDESGAAVAVCSYPCSAAAIRSFLPKRNVMMHPSIMFRNDPIVRYRGKLQPGAEDYDLHLRLLFSHKKTIVNLPRYLLKYRVLQKVSRAQKSVDYFRMTELAQKLFEERQRTGTDSYDSFVPREPTDTDIRTTAEPQALALAVRHTFWHGSAEETRSLLGRLKQTSKLTPSQIVMDTVLRLGPRALSLARRIRRAAKCLPFVARKNAGLRWGRKYQRLALLFATGDGLSTYRDIGSLSREMGLFQALFENGWEVSLYTYDRDHNLPPTGFPSVTRPQWPFLLPGRLNTLYLVLLPLLRWPTEGRPNFVVTSQAHRGWPAVAMAKLWNAKLVARCGWVYGEMAETLRLKGWRVTRRRLLEEFTFRMADRCFVPTRELANWVVDNYGIDEARVEVMPNYVDTNLCRPHDSRERDIDVISVGRLEHTKRHALAIDALSGLGAKFVLIGRGHLADDLSQRARQGTIEIEMIDRVPNDQLVDYFRRAKIYLIASAWEGHPKSLIEAMSCGCACVGTRSPGIRNLIIDKRTGLLTDPDPESVSRALHRLLHDTPLRQKLGKQARGYVIEHCSLDLIAQKYEDALLSLEQ